jgi:hypothetical protein
MQVFSNKQRYCKMSETIGETIAAIDRLRVDAAKLMPALQKHVQETARKSPEQHGTLHRLLVALSDFNRLVSAIVL